MKTGMQLMMESDRTLREAAIDGLEVITRRRGRPITQGDIEICELAIRCLKAVGKLSQPQRSGESNG